MSDKPNDRSDAALRERLVVAEKATKGPWKSDEVVTRKKDFEPSYVVKDKDGFTIVDVLPVSAYQANAAHIAASSPDVVKADIEEILRLRAENNELRNENKALRNKAYLSDLEADWLVIMLSHYTEDCPFRFSQVYEHRYISLDVRGCEKRSGCYDCVAHTPRDCWREVSRNAAMEMINACND